MKKKHLAKLILAFCVGAVQVLASDIQVGGLSDGACWYESKDTLKLVSFNERLSYSGNRKVIETEMAQLAPRSRGEIIRDVDLALHCGGGGLSLVAKVLVNERSFCVWGKVEQGKWVPRSVGAINEEAKGGVLCDGYKWGEFILGVNSTDYLSELQSVKWSQMIKEVAFISQNTYKVTLTREYEFRENEVMNQLDEHFTGKNFIRYLEFNEYRHPVGEFISLR